MNKHDIGLLVFLILLSFSSFFLFLKKEESVVAHVYFEDKLVLTIDLTVDKTYEVEGYNGKVKLEVKDKKIRVNQENSPLHLCSKQGYISKSYESIICLPNKIYVEIDSSDYDAIVR